MDAYGANYSGSNSTYLDELIWLGRIGGIIHKGPSGRWIIIIFPADNLFEVIIWIVLGVI
jgi:hypothetical protein